ncbi:MAG: hypothetical protein QXO75_10285, partial [Nitrososphaerota archaeon]
IPNILIIRPYGIASMQPDQTSLPQPLMRLKQPLTVQASRQGMQVSTGFSGMEIRMHSERNILLSLRLA